MNHHIVLRNTTQAELPAIIEMEQGEAREFIIPYTLQKHQPRRENASFV